jgi:glycosyltransferase involved in cell wall biosynthesis
MNILEAQRNGLPVIAFDVAGPSDIIKSIEQGVLVAPFDVQSFASSILAYYQKWKSDPLAYVRRKQTIAMVSERSFPNEALLESLLGILRGETKGRN